MNGGVQGGSGVSKGKHVVKGSVKRRMRERRAAEAEAEADLNVGHEDTSDVVEELRRKLASLEREVAARNLEEPATAEALRLLAEAKGVRQAGSPAVREAPATPAAGKAGVKAGVKASAAGVSAVKRAPSEVAAAHRSDGHAEWLSSSPRDSADGGDPFEARGGGGVLRPASRPASPRYEHAHLSHEDEDCSLWTAFPTAFPDETVDDLVVALLGHSQSAFDAAVRGESLPPTPRCRSGPHAHSHSHSRTPRCRSGPAYTGTADASQTVEASAAVPVGPHAASEERFPLHEACYDGDLDRVKALLQPGAERTKSRGAPLVNQLSAGAHGFPPLHAAVLSGDELIVSMLLEAGAQVHILSADGLSALQVAVGAGELACTKLLLDAKAAVNLSTAQLGGLGLGKGLGKGLSKVAAGGVSGVSGVAWVDGGVSVLHTASAAGHAAIVQLLLERGASPWALLSDPKQLGATPLAVAAQAGQAECVAMLLDEPHLQFAPAPPADTVAVTTKAPLVGASKNSSSNASKPAAVAKRAKAPLAPYRASNGQSVGTLGDSEPTATGALPAAAGAEMAAELPVLGPLGSRLIATPMTDGRTPLHLACQHGAIETARVLIGAVRSAAPTLIDAVDAAGLSPLDRACQSGHVVVVKLLLEAGATWRREGALNGSTALHVAVEAGKPACVAALLEAKADPEQSDSAGRSPLLLATELGRKECALAMLSAPHLVGVPYPEVSVDVWRAWLTEPFADLGRERAARAALA